MSKVEISYRDLRIQLPKDSTGSFEWSLHQFIDNYEAIVINPRIRKSVLEINSSDFVSYLGYLNIDSLNEFEWAQFKSNAKNEMEQLLMKSLRPQNRHHYTWCLAAVKQLKPGRFLEEET